MLGLMLSWGLIRTGWPTIQDLQATQAADQIISTMTGTTDETHDEARMAALAQAQAYNLRLGGAAPPLDHEGLGGGNGGSDDILDLASSVEADGILSYEEQLRWQGEALLGWVEVPRIGVRQPLYRGTEDETLALGVGHLDWSSLPVGGPSSHCVLAAHSGMRQQRMFDDIDQLGQGDVFVVHTLGDAYQYEVYETEVVDPDEAPRRCSIVDGQDLCTLVTCTPYGINSHRLLVHGRRVTYEPPSEGAASGVTRLATNTRMRPVMALGAGVALIAALTLLAKAVRRVRPMRDRRRTTTFLLLVGSALVLCGLTVAARHRQETRAIAQLSRTVVHDTPAAWTGDVAEWEDPQPIDWDSLRQENGNAVAWVRAEGTDIDLPVVAAREEDTTYYLRHDLWGAWSLEGTPFLDHRCDADGTHRLVFGHHLAMGGQFSMLQRAYRQESFDTLGPCRWYTPAEGLTQLQPFCALCVDQWYEPIQQFSFEDSGRLQAWLATIARDASATAQEWDALAQDARSAVTLVTCSSDLARQRWRTLVVYVEPAPASQEPPHPT